MSTERFFTRPWVIRRLYEGPLATHVDGFAARLSDHGFARSTAQRQIRIVAELSRWMNRRDLTVSDLGKETIDAFLDSRRKSRRLGYAYDATLRMLTDYLRGAGLIAAPVQQPTDSEQDPILGAFQEYLEQERGLSAPTIANHLRVTRRFLGSLRDSGAGEFSQLRAEHIADFFLSQTQHTGWQHAKSVATTLRAFLRFLRLRGAIATDLGACIPHVHTRHLATLPKFLGREQVELLLKHCNRGTARGRRDFAILLLLARLGLRAGEVVAMSLDDIDWEAGELVVHGKGPRTSRLPLPSDVGSAIAEYLLRDRPRCSSRRVFIRAKAPYEGFSRPIAIGHIMRRTLARAGLHPPCTGAYVLRHTLATQMLQQGASLTEIGQILRHRRQDTTTIYAKVDLSKLQEVAQPWPGGES